MAPHARSGRGPKGQKAPPKNGRTEQRQQKRKRENEDLQQLAQRVDELDPKSDAIKNFSDLPLSAPTAKGVEASHFKVLTDVQAHALPLALKGNDVLGAAKTGSGKTLAFIIPVLEKLYRAQWTEYDGLGALIISPTRELAAQIFEVLRKVGRNHVFSAGLIIGGKSLKEEAERLDRMNILVCTPGRMLQHLDQTAGFEVNNLQMLVLDEADRIMDEGFKYAVDALVEHLPQDRQTLMFSATQSQKVSDLARLSLKDPEYVSVHEDAVSATPTNLQQRYIVTPLTEKLNTLYGFIKANVKSKIIVFLSSCKQVRFVYECFRHLQPGIPLLHLHGRQKQHARMKITQTFRAAKHSCVFATDVIARGIDFPAVDWVIQADCPEDVDTYIHRVGRTARYESNGQAVLFLDPSEEPGMLKKLQHKKIPIEKVNVKEKKKRDIQEQLQSMCFQDPNLKYLGQKAFISYIRSLHLQKDKDVFKFNKLDLDGYAASLGLPGTPQLKFRKGEDIKKIKNAPRDGMSSGSESDEEGEKKSKKKNEVRTKYDKMFERTNQDVLSSHYNKLVLDGADNEEEDDFLSVKRVLKDGDLDDEANNAFKSSAKIIDGLGGEEPFVVDSKRREKALKSKKKMLKFKGNSTKVVFDEDGNAHAIYELKDEDDFVGEGPAEEQRRKFVEDEATRVREADVDDKALAKQKRREKREKRKAAERAELLGMVSDDGDAPMLDNADDGEDPLALLRSLPVGGADRSDSDGSDSEPPKKKAKKWFQDDSDDEKTKAKTKGKGKVFKVQDEPETLEDLEALATGLLD
ncbi:atp-dependent rna helicase dbp4 [Fusarium heterosporum]|uniref:ATP-dependent RNA helicase n=1 Tax=Fusarium heterosporum TaxID=42747 RepID=A0A8H5TFI8_FUSHE|nr:atp-dependent rna helicase dbp4 [Fusarium heterosporum]